LFLSICSELPPLNRFLVSGRTRKEENLAIIMASLACPSLSLGWAKADQKFPIEVKQFFL
jgi:hypothetical protein